MTRMERLRSGGVQPGIPVFFYGYATARSSCHGASQRCDVRRAIYHCAQTLFWLQGGRVERRA